MFGLGRIGLVFAETLLQLDYPLELVAYSPVKRRRFTHLFDHPDFRYCNSLVDMHREKFSAYLIASPSDTHFGYLKKVLPEGVPIFCEKPVDLSTKKIEQIKELAGRHGSKVMVGFNRRFDPQVKSLKKSIDDGMIGDIHILRLTSRDPAPPPIKFARTSGGLFLDMVIHDFDMMRYLTNSEPVSIFTKADLRIATKFAAFDDVDTALTTVKMANGTLVSIDTSRKAVYGYDQRIEVFGPKGMLQMNNERHDYTEYFSKKGQQAAPLKDFFMDRYAQSYRLEMEHFLKLISDEKTLPLVNVSDALIATQVALAANKSRLTGREIRFEK